MAETSTTSRQDAIYDDLASSLASGDIRPGEPLPSLRSLALTYDTSVGTIRLALTRLRHEGRIISCHGKGHYAADAIAFKTVLLLTETEGDLWADMVRLFTEHVGADPHTRLLLERAKSSGGGPVFERKIRWMVNEGVDAIIFNGDKNQRLGFLSEFVDQTRLICHWSDEVARTWPCAKVLSDTFHGGYIGTRHLLDQGCRQILLLIPQNYQVKGYHDLKDLVEGCEQARADCPGAEPLVTMLHAADHPGSPERFRQCLAENPRIDGIFSAGDFRFEHLAPALQGMGRRVPDDIKLLGYFDTPWCRAFNPQLSSVNIQPERFVEAIGEMLRNGRDERVLIRPRLVIRGSSSAS